MKNSIEDSEDDLTRSDLNKTFENHLKNARTENEYLNRNRSKSKSDSAEFAHVIMDFAEKVLLPSLLEQPGQLHFITVCHVLTMCSILLKDIG